MQLSRCLAPASAGIARPHTGRQLCVAVRAERLSLGNLAPAPGSKRDKQHKGRGTAAGQVRVLQQRAGAGTRVRACKCAGHDRAPQQQQQQQQHHHHYLMLPPPPTHTRLQGGTCGFGNRGQKARSGPGTRTGFEGGQMPLYRRLPKLKGICGGGWRWRWHRWGWGLLRR